MSYTQNFELMNTKKTSNEKSESGKQLGQATIPILDEPLLAPQSDLDLDSLDIPILTEVIAEPARPADQTSDSSDNNPGDENPTGEKDV